MKTHLCLFLFIVFPYLSSFSQSVSITGKVISNGTGLAFANVWFDNRTQTKTDSLGSFKLTVPASLPVQLHVNTLGFKPFSSKVESSEVTLDLTNYNLVLNEITVTASSKETSRSESPIAIETYKSGYFKANPTPTMLEAVQQINGVRPQINCNVCNAGDIHINGQEGAYTMVLIEGMPIVGGLASIYGLNGIPNAIIERIEVVKGPAATMYGSESVGGMINVITKKSFNAPIVSLDLMSTSWLENNADFSGKFKLGSNATILAGLNVFHYNYPKDLDKDGFTDITMQKRFSTFLKSDITRKNGKIFSNALRFVHENRFGGQLDYAPEWRGSDSIYGEHVKTNRWESFGFYELSMKEKIQFQYSVSGHYQDSYYGTMLFKANQLVSFGQILWNKKISSHELLSGIAMRYTFYDDNTSATFINGSNGRNDNVRNSYLPGVFIQDEWKLNTRSLIHGGVRYDFNNIHGSIITPRIGFKYASKNGTTIVKTNSGKGYRIANVIAEDHAALTGARQVVFKNELNPETSWNLNLNLLQRFYGKSSVLTLDFSGFYTYFGNKIIPDYETNPTQIIYDNLSGYAVSRGVSLNAELLLGDNFTFYGGSTLMDVYSVENNKREWQLFSENFSAVWSVQYLWRKAKLTFNLTGNLYSPMRLPLASNLDPRPFLSDWYSPQNFQLTWRLKAGIEFYAGIKNFLNHLPGRNSPFLIARSFDPFDKKVSFDSNGTALSTPENPYALTFDPSYVYASNQGIRYFAGVRYSLF